MTVDRLAVGYVPTWDIDAQVGRQGELVVADLIAALKEGASVEVKTDEKFADTGNVYFEYGCQRAAGWKPSGLAIVHAEVWVHVLGADGGCLVLDVASLKAAARALRADGYTKACSRGSHPTRGVCAPLLIFLTYYRAAKTEASAMKEAA